MIKVTKVLRIITVILGALALGAILNFCLGCSQKPKIVIQPPNSCPQCPKIEIKECYQSLALTLHKITEGTDGGIKITPVPIIAPGCRCEISVDETRFISIDRYSPSLCLSQPKMPLIK